MAASPVELTRLRDRKITIRSRNSDTPANMGWDIIQSFERLLQFCQIRGIRDQFQPQPAGRSGAAEQALGEEAYGPTLMRHFQNQSRLLADSSRRQNSPPDHSRWKTSQRLTEITLEETLRGSVFIGSSDTVVGKLKDLQRDIGLSGAQLETIAPARPITRQSEKRSGYWLGRSSRLSVERGFEPPR